MIRKSIAAIFGSICVYLIVAGVYAQTCTVDDSDSNQGMFEKLAPKRCLPEDSKTAGKDTGTPINGDHKETLEETGLSQKSLKQMQILGKSPIYLDGPAALLGQQDYLELTSQQKIQLMDLLGEMRVRAHDILTPKQRARIKDVPNQPISIDQICRQMREQMSKNKNGEANNNSEFKCPMCPTLQNRDESPSSQPARE
jgi:hypothetical protein